MEQSLEQPPFWAEGGPQCTRYNELDTFLRMSSFAWHAELACRKWLERGAAFPDSLNRPKTTAWMYLLIFVNPALDASQEFGISPAAEPEVSILRAYQLLLSGLSVEQVVEFTKQNPLPTTIAEFLING